MELGANSSFDLTLELFSGTTNEFALEVVNLPRQIGRFFKDPIGSVRLSQVKFTQSNRTKRAALEVQLPDRPSSGVQVDTPISFFVLVLPDRRAPDMMIDRSRLWSEEEIQNLNVGYVRLELVPRGTGKIKVSMPQLYHAIDVSESATVRADIANEGSDRIDNLEIRLDLPLNWRGNVIPESVMSVGIGRDTSFSVTIVPPQSVAPGKYEVRMRTSGISNGRPITTEDKSITIEIRPDTNIAGTVTVVLILLGLVFGIVVYGVRLVRR